MDPLHVTAPEDEIVRLNYFQDSEIFEHEKPYEILSQAPPGIERSNFQLRPGQPETINDLRGLRTIFNLDQNGFQVVSNTLKTSCFDEATIKKDYLPSIEALLKSVEPDIDVHFFDWTLRSSGLPDPKPGTIVNLNDPMLCLKPVQDVHVDQSPFAAIKRAKSILGNDISLLQTKRIRIINIWRPMYHPVEDWPLAVCDGSTVPPEKLIKVDHVRKHHIGESLYPLESDRYRWYYLNKQTPDEALLIKMFDSKEDVVAKCCPHTSFQKKKIAPSGKARESIEVRALVVSSF
ncbi:hypothetical protein FOQG_15837 [Fusarium oxysporum f. sp. raphani 54005]|uniref:Methyltransferase n=3 Tax=Fusarium oxysporum TaxID=5507 RepID=X0BCT1_FUSOX|nr:hypothetical protein FOVG_16944 [Fusarium oxysporum f. sp. pisi HDV247]EXK79596.1 hypothetical protein FOQG_15837 [Fusarium oxysporum f. sp. raphani 54005]KAG7432696.1 Aspirochlorine biosynthesis protein N [Fusarium oxysporum f. sp. raphani]